MIASVTFLVLRHRRYTSLSRCIFHQSVSSTILKFHLESGFEAQHLPCTPFKFDYLQQNSQTFWISFFSHIDLTEAKTVLVKQEECMQLIKPDLPTAVATLQVDYAWKHSYVMS